jgi:hypothetical protein
MQSPPSPSSQSGLSRLANWWFRLVTPERSRQPQWREELASFIMPIILLTVIFPIPSAIGQPPRLILLCTVLLIDILALFLKKKGHFRLAGIMVVATIEFGLAMAIIATPGPNGMDATRLTFFASLVETGLVVIAFFSPPMILIITAMNCAFFVIALQVFRVAPSFQALLDKQGASIYISMIQLHLFVAFVAAIIMGILIRAIHRADTAEKLAELEAMEIKRQEELLAVSKQIEDGIQQIMATLNNVVTQNDFTIRVPLKQENILWRVGRSINNLLSRLQGLKQNQEELKRTHAVAAKVAERMRDGLPIPLTSWTGTAFDPVIIEYNKRVQHTPPQLTKKRLIPNPTEP